MTGGLSVCHCVPTKFHFASPKEGSVNAAEIKIAPSFGYTAASFG